MALDFPSNPSDGQTYNNYIWSASTGAWRSLNSIYASNALKNSTISTGSASTVPLTVQGLTSQSANLQEWKNSSGNILSSISPSGWLNVPGLGSSGAVIATTPIDGGSAGGVVVKAPSGGSQTSGYIQFTNNTSTTEYASISANSSNMVSLSGNLTVSGRITQSGLIYATGYVNGPEAGGMATYHGYISSNGISYTSSPNARNTVSVAGLYHIGMMTISQNSSGRRDGRIYINGVISSQSLSEDSTTGYHYKAMGIYRYLQANDYVEFYNDSWWNFASPNDSWKTFFIVRVG